MQAVTITQITPPELETLIQNVIEKALNGHKPDKLPDTPELLTIDEASAFLRLAKPTIYSMVSRGRLPYMKRAKKLYFSRIELMEYLRQGKVQTIDQSSPEALRNVIVKRKGISHA
jgi:excisionase family DNA binding protein